MPALLLRILTLLTEAKAEINTLQTITRVMGGNTKKLFNMINGLTKTQEEALAKRFGNKMLNRVKSSVNQENKPQNIPTTKVKSS